jgi:hypothetical protein
MSFPYPRLDLGGDSERVPRLVCSYRSVEESCFLLPGYVPGLEIHELEDYIVAFFNLLPRNFFMSMSTCTRT